MVFFFKNWSSLLWEENVIMIEKKFEAEDPEFSIFLRTQVKGRFLKYFYLVTGGFYIPIWLTMKVKIEINLWEVDYRNKFEKECFK